VRPTRIGFVGDSWGEPQWRDPFPGYSADQHSSLILHGLGYDVTNASQAGGSNLVTWRNLEQHAGMRNLDVIVWFHTEIARDWPWARNRSWSLDTLLHDTARSVYRECDQIRARTCPHTPIWLVEGQAGVIDPEFGQHFEPHWWTRTWRSSLCGRTLPDTHLLSIVPTQPQMWRSCQDGKKQRNQMVSDVETVMQAMVKCPKYFTDRCHPNNLAHAELARLIAETIPAQQPGIV